jgi:membrane protein YdbS with pleckstrin-like domain
MEDKNEEQMFVLRPNITNAIIPKIVHTFIFTAFFVAILSIPFGTLLVDYFKLNLGLVIFLAILLFLVLFSIPVFWFYMNLKQRKYIFFKDRIEYYEGWMTIVRHVVPYEKVTDLTLIKTIWDRFFNTATIGLLTASFYGSVHINYVNNPEEVLNHLQKLVLKKK